MHKQPPKVDLVPLLRFFLLAYVISWSLWAPAVLAAWGWIGPVPSRYFHLAGGLGPLLAAVVLSASRDGRVAIVRLARACVAGRWWLLLAVVIPAGLFLAAAIVLVLFKDVSIDAGAVGRGSEFPEFPRTVYAIANFVCYGLGEEVGWRGFALPRLQASRSALRASLLLAIGWAGWHLPLFAFSPGMASMGPAGALGWFASLCVGSILLTWLFNSSGGSIGVVALFHGALDIFMMSPVAPGLTNVMGALLTVGTLLLIPVFGRQNLARRPRVTSSADFAPAQDPGGVT
jgi:membrane protease YdiL (CAAX protease family)